MFREFALIFCLVVSSCNSADPVQETEAVAPKPSAPSKLSAFSDSLSLSPEERQAKRLAEMTIETDGAFAVIETQTATHDRYLLAYREYLEGSSKYDYEKILDNLDDSQTDFYARVEKLIEEDAEFLPVLPHDVALLENLNCMSVLLIAAEQNKLSIADRDKALEAHVKDAVAQTISQVDVRPEDVYVLHRINHVYVSDNFEWLIEPEYIDEAIEECASYERIIWRIEERLSYQNGFIIP